MSRVTLTKIVMPGQANSRGLLFGGVLLAMMDEAAAIVALRHARTTVVTAHVASVDFEAPIHQGEAAEVTATVVGVGRTSMRVSVRAVGENLLTGARRPCTSAEFVMVALDAEENPTPVPPLPEEA
jgi:acyl-CoA hydrolase